VATPSRSIPGVSDEELIERARTGDRAAFGDLVERYQQAVFRAALAALRSREDAEEVAQDAFLTAFQKLDTFRGESSFKTWLLTITWNRALDRRRRVGEWLKRFVSRDEESGPWDPAAPGITHEQALMDEEARRGVRHQVRRLPPKYRDALLLSASGDHTFEEIGQLLGVPTGTAKWRAMEGRRLLKQRLVGRAQARTKNGPAAQPEPAGE